MPLPPRSDTGIALHHSTIHKLMEFKAALDRKAGVCLGARVQGCGLRVWGFGVSGFGVRAEG